MTYQYSFQKYTILAASLFENLIFRLRCLKINGLPACLRAATHRQAFLPVFQEFGGAYPATAWLRRDERPDKWKFNKSGYILSIVFDSV
jgi:hypothetical protein